MKPLYSDKLNIYSPISLHWLIIIIICFIHLSTSAGQKQNAIQVSTFKSDTTTKSIFIIDRKPFAFVGGFIPGWHFSDEDCTNVINENLIKTAKENGINVLHVMLPSIESQLGVFNELEVAKLDRFLNYASKYGIYIMPEIIHGLDIATQTNHPYFHPHGIEGLIKDSLLKNSFKERIKFLLNHKNYVSGVRYLDDPTILSWILVAEPLSASFNYPLGAPNITIEQLKDWTEEMASFTKTIDPNHLVTIYTTAAIDAYGQNWIDVFKAQSLDFAYAEDADMRIITYFAHLNPIDYPLPLLSLNKPLVIGISFTSGEWGGTGICNDNSLQSKLIKSALNKYFDAGITGNLVQSWGSTLYPYVPTFGECFNYNSSNDTICQVFQEFAKKTNTLNWPIAPLQYVKIKTTTKISIDTIICKGLSYYAGGKYQTTTGLYYDTLDKTEGFDTVTTTNLVVNVCANLNSLSFNESTKVFPIPTKGILNIDCENLRYIELYNNSGVFILRTKKNYIDFSKYCDGIYYLNIFDNYNNKITRKVLFVKD